MKLNNDVASPQKETGKEAQTNKQNIKKKARHRKTLHGVEKKKGKKEYIQNKYTLENKNKNAMQHVSNLSVCTKSKNSIRYPDANSWHLYMEITNK